MPRAGKPRRRPNRSPENRHERHEKRGRPCVENCWSAGNDGNSEKEREEEARDTKVVRCIIWDVCPRAQDANRQASAIN